MVFHRFAGDRSGSDHHCGAQLDRRGARSDAPDPAPGLAPRPGSGFSHSRIWCFAHPGDPAGGGGHSQRFRRAQTGGMGRSAGQPHPGGAAYLRDEFVSVYVPTTPNPTGGYFVMVRKSDCVELDMSVDAALRYIVSMGVVEPADPLSETPK